MAKRKTKSKKVEVIKTGNPTTEELLELKRKKLKKKQEALALREKTKKAIEERPVSTVVDTSKKYPEYMCWRCKQFTPIKFSCKHCKEKNPHRDVVINKKDK